MKPTATLLAILALTTGGALFAQSLAPDVRAIELHVSPTGDDNASGAALEAGGNVLGGVSEVF